MNDKLTLTLGLRFDYQFARTESQQSVLDVRSEHAQSWRGRYPGALDLRGKRPGPDREPDVPRHPTRTPGGRGLGACLSTRRQERDPRRLRDLLLGRGVRAVRRAADARIPGQPARPEPDQRRASPRSIWTMASPQNRDRPAALHRPDVRQRDGTDRGGAERVDAAALPELVRDVPAPADQQHDAGHVVHRQPREPPEPPLADAGRRTRT